MTQYRTNNPLGSMAPRDLYDNAQNVDNWSNGEEPFYEDRFGVMRRSFSGMNFEFEAAQDGRTAAFDAQMAALGYVSKGAYAAGVVLERYNEYVAVPGVVSGGTPAFYRPGPNATLPLTLEGDWDIDGPLLLQMDADDVLRGELADGGANLVGLSGGGTLADINHAVTPQMFGATAGQDATAALQAALSDPRPVLVIPENYLVNVETRLYPPSGKKIVFVGAGKLTAIAATSAFYSIFDIENKEDISFYNLQLVGDRDIHLGTGGEQGFGIRCLSSKRIKVIGGDVSNFWGDGLYFGATDTATHTNCEDITIIGVNSHHNRRQGLSMTGVMRAHVEASRFNDTNGTNPQSGVDLEPNAGFVCKDIVFINCEAERNAGAGFEMLDASNSGAVERISFINCPARANGSNGLRLVSARKVTHTGEISDNVSHGVYAIQGSNNLSLPRPDIHDNGGDGVQILTNSVGASIGEGRIFSNQGFGVNSSGRINLSLVEIHTNQLGGWYFGAGAVRSKAIECYVHDNGGTGGETAAAETRVVGGEYSANSTATNAAAHNLAVYANDCQVIGGVKSRVGTNTNKPAYGLRSTGNSGLVFKGNDFRGAGVTGDIATVTLTNADISDNHPYNRMGTTAQRPTTNLQVGMSYYDTSLGKPVWYFGGATPWRDAAGAGA